jgi:VanZ family protein
MKIAVFITYAALITFVSLRPTADLPEVYISQVLHLIAYAVFAWLGYLAASGSHKVFHFLCAGIVTWGGILEVIQSQLPGRVMSLNDFLANTTGVLLVLILVNGWMLIKKAGD